MIKIKFFFLLYFLSYFSMAQKLDSALTISGYAEVYWGKQNINTQSNERPEFLYNHKRTNEVGVNLAYLKAAYDTKNVRANLALMTGHYAKYNLSHESALFQNVFEANVGIKLLKKQNLWLDAGVFPSHIGFESAISKDCWTLTRSLVAENSPYYEAGAKLNYSTDKWYVALLYLNGWQSIENTDEEAKPSWGTQFTFKPNAKVTLNVSTFSGDILQQFRLKRRYFNFYGVLQLFPKTGLTVGYDVGMQKTYIEGEKYLSWKTPVIMLKQQWTPKMSMTARFEKFIDPHGFIISHFDERTIQGLSLNTDFAITKNALLRVEGRMLTFNRPQTIDMIKTNSSLAVSLSAGF